MDQTAPDLTFQDETLEIGSLCQRNVHPFFYPRTIIILVTIVIAAITTTLLIEKVEPEVNQVSLLKQSLIIIVPTPLRDRYLLSVLEKMNNPIVQMFPELEGYTGKKAYVLM